MSRPANILAGGMNEVTIAHDVAYHRQCQQDSDEFAEATDRS